MVTTNVSNSGLLCWRQNDIICGRNELRLNHQPHKKMAVGYKRPMALEGELKGMPLNFASFCIFTS
jgi:hypothetical protein